MPKTKVIGDYEIEVSRVLGAGSFATVYPGVRRDTGEPLAFKTVSKQLFRSSFNLKTVLGEISIMKRLSHPNLCTMLDVLQTNQNIYIVSEMCDSDLESELRERGGYGEKQAVQIFRQVLAGVSYLLENGLVHRDIKAANVLVRNGVYKLTDFGFARQLSGQMFTQSTVGTPCYMSPQILLREEYSSKADIWSLGLLLYQLVFNSLPWEANNEKDLLREQRKEVVIFPSPVTPLTKTVIRECLRFREQDRIGWGQLLRLCGVESGGLAEHEGEAERSCLGQPGCFLLQSIGLGSREYGSVHGLLLDKQNQGGYNRTSRSRASSRGIQILQKTGEPFFRKVKTRMQHNRELSFLQRRTGY